MRNKKIALGGIAAVAVVGFAGTAMTAGNTIPASIAGYGDSTVSGATATGVEHTLSADGTTVDSTLVTFSTDLDATHQVKAAFGTAALENCVVDVAANTAACDYVTVYDTATATSFVVAVS